MGSLVLGALHLVPGVTTSVQVMPQNDDLNGRDGTCHGAPHCSCSLLLLRLQLLLLRLSYFCNLAVHRVRQMLRHAPAPSSLRRAWHSSSYTCQEPVYAKMHCNVADHTEAFISPSMSPFTYFFCHQDSLSSMSHQIVVALGRETPSCKDTSAAATTNGLRSHVSW